MNPIEATAMLPIEVQFSITEDVLRKSESLHRRFVEPWWTRLLEVTVIGALAISVIGSVVSSRHWATSLALTVCACIFGGGILQRRAKRRKRMAETLGRVASVKFDCDAVGLSGHEPFDRIAYAYMSRMGTDIDGLFIQFPLVGLIWIPAAAFRSAEEREIVIAHLKKEIGDGIAGRESFQI